jgi:phosphoribosyl 1,2-cyclic phosphodiesterase
MNIRQSDVIAALRRKRGRQHGPALARALIDRARSTNDPRQRDADASEALRLVIPHALTPEPPDAKREILETLRIAADIVRPELARILAGRDPMHDPPTSDIDIVISYYLAGILSQAGSVGERVLRKKRELEPVPNGGGLLPFHWYIEFLKSYSSVSPLFPYKGQRNEGGGYFLALGRRGCVIDPGHHFLDNFLSAGHAIDDIDAIVVTHHHDDHFADFVPLLSLLSRRSKSNRRRPIRLFLDRLTADCFASMIRRKKFIKECVVLEPQENQAFCICRGVSLTPLPTAHDVFGKRSGVGLCIDIHVGKRRLRIVITGDTAWNPIIAASYRLLSHHANCVLVAHVSTAWEDELTSLFVPRQSKRKRRSKPTIKPRYYPKHLAVHGLCSVIEILRPSRVVLSEIGEELDVPPNGLDYLCSLIAAHYGIACLVGMKDRSGERIVF